MAQEDKVARPGKDTDEALLLKKRARRRLIGSAVLASAAVIILPMVMDHQPPPPLRDIQVRIPSPDEGAPQRMIVPTKPIANPEPRPVVQTGETASPEAERKLEDRPETNAGSTTSTRLEVKPEPKSAAESKTASGKSAVKPQALQSAAQTTSAVQSDVWEIQLGAYAEPGRVRTILAKLKELGVPTFTEQVSTSNGSRTRVRAGPFQSEEAAEKARTRVKLIGIDGPVVRKS